MINRSYILFFAILLGVGTGLWHQEYLLKAADTISSLFISFLQLLASPIVFLSILSTLLGMRGVDEMRLLGKKVFAYTLITTILATLVALSLFLIIDPLSAFTQTGTIDSPIHEGSYFSFLMKIIPSNFCKAFLENNVIGIAFIAVVLGLAALKLPEENKAPLCLFFSSLFKLILKTTEFAILFMPIAVWAFMSLLIAELQQNSSQFRGLSFYLMTVLGANLIQGIIILPLLLKLKKLSPLKLSKGCFKALVTAFFSKSSNATLPLTLQCAENQLKIKSKIAHFSLPLCTVINMNGCAAFILTTVLFVAGVNGISFSAVDYGLFVLFATLAAIGNAGVPMGCFFLSSAFLISMGVPIKLMGLILTFYTFIDMVETTLNVWSDVCVTAIVDKEIAAEAITELSPQS